MNIRVRELAGIRGVALSEPAEADLALINSAYAPQPVTAADVHVRQARVAHNQYDRTLERFPKAMLERFAETLPGKSLLPGHDTGALPLGRWFRAETRTRTEEFPVLQPGKSLEGGGEKAEIVPGFQPARQRVTWLEAAFYFTNDPGTELFRKNIDSGVYQDVSIGFSYDDVECDVCKASYWKSSCPHYRGQRLDDGTLVTLTYSGDPKAYEARETSIVYLGAQQHAELTKQLREGRVDPEALARTAWGTDMVALKDAEALARKHGHAPKSWAFPTLSPPVGGDPSPVGDHSTPAADVATTEKDMSKLLERAKSLFDLPDTATEDEAVKAVETAATHAKRVTEAEAALAAAEAQAKALEPAAEVGKTALADLEREYIAHAVRLGENETDAKDIAGLYASKGDYAGLKQRVERKFAAVCEKFPLGLAGDPSAGHQPTPAAPRLTGRDIRAEALA